MTVADPSLDTTRRSMIEQVYRELRAIAAAAIRHERPDHTLQPTALAHEAYIRLRHYLGDEPAARPDFLRLAALTVRRVLLDHARRHHARRRAALELSDSSARDGADQPPMTWLTVDIIALDRSLDRLAALDPRKADVVQLRFFCGLTMDEIAACLDVSPRTVAHDWSLARAWLRRNLGSASPTSPV